MIKKILLLIPQNVIPATDGGKIGIFKPMQKLAAEFNVKAMVFVDQEEKANAQPYSKINVDVTFLAVSKKDTFLSAIFNIGNKMPFKFQKYYLEQHKLFIEKTCNNWKPDAIICHHAHLANYCRDIKRKFPAILLLLREHNVEYLLVEQYCKHQRNLILRQFAYWQFQKTKRFERRSWDYFDNVIFISDSDFKHHTVDSISKAQIIYDGTDNIAEYIEVPEEKINAFLFSGSLRSYQNQINLHHFVHNIWIPWKKNYQGSFGYELWVTGDKDTQFVQQQLGLNKSEVNEYKIQLLGFVDDIVVVMTKAKFFLSPTIIGAGIRIKVLQAMGLGCVVFLTQKDLDISVEFKHSQNVILYEDTASFNKNFELLSTIPNPLYVKIAARAALCAKEHFTWDIFYNKLKTLINVVNSGTENHNN